MGTHDFDWSVGRQYASGTEFVYDLSSGKEAVPLNKRVYGTTKLYNNKKIEKGGTAARPLFFTSAFTKCVECFSQVYRT